jgi:hypothetical protein
LLTVNFMVIQLGRRAVGFTLLLALIGAIGSYSYALVYPGEASFSVRTVEWVRDHGGNPLVDALENWWFTRRAPAAATGGGGVAHAGFEVEPGLVGPRTAEGRWLAGPMSGGSTPPMFCTLMFPDPEHPGVSAAIARFDQHRVAARLIAGTREPDQRAWPERARIPVGQWGRLVAAFNSGFKMDGANGGFFADGRMARPLRDGAASLVITRDGRVSVDQWGRDRAFGPDILAVRQNLRLVVDDGQVVAGLTVNRDDRWGSAKNQLQYTWRSGAGVDAAGRLYYIAGADLTLETLARALAGVGVVRGMELDIHPAEVHFFGYRHRADGTPVPVKLLGTMRGPSDRYLRPDQRDFLALTLR